MGTLQDGPPHLERPLPRRQLDDERIVPPGRMDVRRKVSTVDDEARASAGMPTRSSR